MSQHYSDPTERVTVTIRQTTRCDPKGYFVLTQPDGEEVGCDSKAMLMRYAKKMNWRVDYIPLPEVRKNRSVWE